MVTTTAARRCKIVLIGAGSAMFTRGLLADLIRSGRSWTVALVDTDEQALQAAAGLCRRMVAARPADIVLEHSTERRDVLAGAAVVVTTIGVGGRRAWEADVFIPRRFGIYQPVGDTVMPGGIARALRMVPAMVDIARDVLALCPQAHVFNYANPMTVNCWAVRQATGANIVGLCHGVMHVERDLAAFLSVPLHELTSLAVGLNHLTWLYDLRYQGHDLMPALRERVAAAGGLPRRGDNPFSCALLAEFGAYPAVHDRHVTEFFARRFPGGRYDGRTLGVDAYPFEDTIALGDRIYEEMRAQAQGEAALDDVCSSATLVNTSNSWISSWRWNVMNGACSRPTYRIGGQCRTSLPTPCSRCRRWPRPAGYAPCRCSTSRSRWRPSCAP